MLHALCFDGPPLSDPFFKMRSGGLSVQSRSVKDLIVAVAPLELWEWWLDECGSFHLLGGFSLEMTNSPCNRGRRGCIGPVAAPEMIPR